MLLRWGLTVAFGFVTLAAQAQMPLENTAPAPPAIIKAAIIARRPLAMPRLLCPKWALALGLLSKRGLLPRQ